MFTGTKRPPTAKRQPAMKDAAANKTVRRSWNEAITIFN